MSIYLIVGLSGFVMGLYIGFGLACMIANKRRMNDECNGPIKW